MSKTMTKTVTKSVTNTQLLIATAVLLGVTGLALALLPLTEENQLPTIDSQSITKLTSTNATITYKVTFGSTQYINPEIDFGIDSNDLINRAKNLTVNMANFYDEQGNAIGFNGTIDLTDLTLNTIYYYQIILDLGMPQEVRSPIYQFKTLNCAGLLGDLNNSGKLDAEDESRIIQMIAGTAAENGCADMDNDSIIGPGDLVIFKNKLILQNAPKCSDSDGGKNYFVSGYVLIKNTETNSLYNAGTDTCAIQNAEGGYEKALSGPYVTEFSCNQNGESYKEAYKCPSGTCINGACKPVLGDAKVFTCAPKPEPNTVWNTVYQYDQKYEKINNTTNRWEPQNSITTYNIIPSVSSCRYKCAKNYSWDAGNSQCIPAGGPVTPPFKCTGNTPSNATLCTGDNIGLTANTPITLVPTCTSTKCEYICNQGYKPLKGTCQ